MYVMATFEKCGSLRYISHLDLQRAMTRLLIRTELPLVFSEGFNPHPRLTFAQPLSIFQESVCEVAIFRIDPPLPEERILDALRAAAPEGLLFKKVACSEKKPPECRAARYELWLEGESTLDALRALTAGPMPVLKKTKAKEATVVDISPLLSETEWKKTENGFLLTCVLPCGNQTLNPSYVASYLEEHAPVRWKRILRTELFF